jgi:hypothetical protein
MKNCLFNLIFSPLHCSMITQAINFCQVHSDDSKKRCLVSFFPSPLPTSRTFPLHTFPLHTFPLHTFPLHTFPLHTFPLRTFTLDTFPPHSPARVTPFFGVKKRGRSPLSLLPWHVFYCWCRQGRVSTEKKHHSVA